MEFLKSGGKAGNHFTGQENDPKEVPIVFRADRTLTITMFQKNLSSSFRTSFLIA